MPRHYCEDCGCQYNTDTHCGVKDGKYPDDANCFDERQALESKEKWDERQAELERAYEQEDEWNRISYG